MKKASLHILLALVLIACAPVLASGYVAVVMDVQRESLLASSEAEYPLLVLDFLGESDMVRVPENAVLVLNYFAPGMRERIEGPVTLRATSSGSEILEQAGGSVERAHLEFIPSPASMESVHIRNYGSTAIKGRTIQRDKDFKPVFPVSTALRPGASPVFSWNAAPGAGDYVLRVRNQKDEELLAQQVAATSFALAEALFAPGETYWWRVTALCGDERVASDEAFFRVLGASLLAELEEKERAIALFFPQGGTESQAAHALLYLEYGLHGEAAPLLKQLKTRSPARFD